MKFSKVFLITLLNISPSIETFSPNGYCNAPVVDLLPAPIHTFFKNSTLSAKKLYQELPFDDTTHGTACPRLGQLLLHDPVEIIKYVGDEVYIKVPQWQYHANGKINSNYWTLRTNITLIKPATQPYVPHAHAYQTHDQVIIALQQPWYDKKTKTTYSAGTRFVGSSGSHPSHKHHRTNRYKKTYTVYSLVNDKITQINLPKTHAVVETKKDKNSARKEFIQLLDSWSCDVNSHAYKKYAPKKNQENYIPYVLGGSSYSHRYRTNPPYKDTKIDCSTGFDCSHLITRAAQLSGIPLYSANSAMLLNVLRPLAAGEPLENGDIIYFTGHVAIISDIDNNLLTEARSQSTNGHHGLVQTIPLHHQFKDITTVTDLTDAYHKKKKIIRLNQDGQTVQTIHKISLLKLC